MHSAIGYAPPRIVPQQDDLQRAAEVLNAGQRIAILVGAGALGASAEVIEAAEVLGAGVAKALLGKAALPDDLPFVTGSVGWLGTAASNEMMTRCDTLLMIGSGFPYTEFLPQEGQARGVQIDINPGMLSLRYPMEVELVGDSAETLRALLPLLEPKTDRAWRREIEASVRDWREEASPSRTAAGRPGQPAAGVPRVIAAPARRLRPDRRFGHLDCLVRAGSGDPAGHARLRLRNAGHDGLWHPLCHRRQVRLSRARGAGPDRRRRHADERPDRVGDDCQVLAGVVRSRG